MFRPMRRIKQQLPDEEALELCRKLARRFNLSEEEIEKEVQTYGAHMQMMALISEHITGKRIHEA